MALSFLLTQGHCPPVFTTFNYVVSRSLPSTCTSTHISTVFKTPLSALANKYSLRSQKSWPDQLLSLCLSLAPTMPPKPYRLKSSPMSDLLLNPLVKPGSSRLVFQAYWMRSTALLGTLASCSRSSLIRRPQCLPARAPGPSSF